MELTIALAITIINAVLGVVNFATSRKDKAIKDIQDNAKEHTNQELIDYRLTQVEKKLDKILDILDNYDKEIDERVEKAIQNHLKLYHKGEE